MNDIFHKVCVTNNIIKFSSDVADDIVTVYTPETGIRVSSLIIPVSLVRSYILMLKGLTIDILYVVDKFVGLTMTCLIIPSNLCVFTDNDPLTVTPVNFSV